MTFTQSYDRFVILDFEATCKKDLRMDPQEIIEFPAIIVDTVNFEILDSFHSYVQPQIIKKLTPFCINLTGKYY